MRTGHTYVHSKLAMANRTLYQFKKPYKGYSDLGAYMRCQPILWCSFFANRLTATSPGIRGQFSPLQLSQVMCYVLVSTRKQTVPICRADDRFFCHLVDTSGCDLGFAFLLFVAVTSMRRTSQIQHAPHLKLFSE